MNAADLVALLQEFARDKLALRERHIHGAARVSNYDFNNTYQYVINREDTQISWLRQALADLGSAFPEVGAPLAVPSDGKGAAREQAIISEDVRQVRGFLEKWTPRVEAMTHARHRKMCQVLLGETVEHRRFFEQMVDGRPDVLGRRTGGRSTGGGVLPVRWLGR